MKSLTGLMAIHNKEKEIENVMRALTFFFSFTMSSHINVFFSFFFWMAIEGLRKMTV